MSDTSHEIVMRMSKHFAQEKGHPGDKIVKIEQLQDDVAEGLHNYEKQVLQLRSMVLQIPLSTELSANRYDTDDEVVLHVWTKTGESWDIKFRKHRYVNVLEMELGAS